LPEAGYPSGQGAVRACLTRLPAKGVVCVCAVRFQDVESARAAFAMGQVTYRCLFCGGEHVSGTQDGRWCLNSAREYWGWKFVRQPVPPEPARNAGLAYQFAVAAYAKLRNGLQNYPEEMNLPEYVLALDPRCDLRTALAQVAAEENKGARQAVEEAWEAYRRLWLWLDSLAGHRPPCELVSVERGEWVRMAGEVAVLASVTVRPAVPCPFPEVPELIRVPAHRYVGLEPLLYAGYGPAGFGAVSVSGTVEAPLKGHKVVVGLTARVHRYGSDRVLERTLPAGPGGGADAFAELLQWVCSATGAPGYEELMQKVR
jgi:hypothetical protein